MGFYFSFLVRLEKGEVGRAVLNMWRIGGICDLLGFISLVLGSFYFFIIIFLLNKKKILGDDVC